MRLDSCKKGGGQGAVVLLLLLLLLAPPAAFLPARALPLLPVAEAKSVQRWKKDSCLLTSDSHSGSFATAASAVTLLLLFQVCPQQRGRLLHDYL
jgi:hypothetical protein